MKLYWLRQDESGRFRVWIGPLCSLMNHYPIGRASLVDATQRNRYQTSLPFSTAAPINDDETIG